MRCSKHGLHSVPSAKRLSRPPSRRWDLQNAGLLLHESHAVHEWEGTADEHARTMSGAHWLSNDGSHCVPLPTCACAHGWISDDV